jgi:CRISPR-associated protein Csd1
MLLQRLSEYADTLPRQPRLYAEGPVRYILELDASGRLLSPRPTDTADPSSSRTKRGVRRLVPQITRSSGVKALLLADKGDYALGIGGPDAKPDRVNQCHEAFRTLVEQCAEATGEPSVRAVASFLADDPAGRLDLGDDFDPSAVVTFRVDGVFPIEVRAVADFWAQINEPGDLRMQCIVCGQKRPVLSRLQAKLKGVPGGQTSGTSLISANADAFESYGLEASLVAPTCTSCGERFTLAANSLLSDGARRVVLGGAAFLFWTAEPADVPWGDFFTQPDPDQVRALVESVRQGREPAPVDASAFYGTVLSGSGGRAVVRDWIDTTVGEAKRRIAVWFQHQRIVDAWGAEAAPLGVYALAAATVRDPRTDLAPPVPRALLRAALTATPPSMDLLYGAVRRSRAEQGVNRQRAALIKLVLLSHMNDSEEEAMVRLDPEHPSAAYRCGRLLAVLEAIQHQALPTAKATIVDRFYGTASSAPASVFARLVRGAQPHLGKLERDRPGAYRALQGRLEDILGGLDSFPTTLSLQDQGLFALGYYHQRAHDRAQAKEARERRAQAPENGAPDLDDSHHLDREET